MKYARLLVSGQPHYALQKEDGYHLLRGGLTDPPQETGAVVSFEDAKLLPPCTPSKIIAVGLNYADHAKEMQLPIPDFPALFYKPVSAVIGPLDTIIMPPMAKRVDYEGELAFVIGKEASYVEESKAGDYIFGYTCLNDVTARDLQKLDSQWTRAKGFDTFCPIGPVIETDVGTGPLHIETRLNGVVKQDSSTKQLIFPPERLVYLLSQIMTLLPGDVITTGTSSGIGPMQAGDCVEVEIEHIGILKNTVKELSL